MNEIGVVKSISHSVQFISAGIYTALGAILCDTNVSTLSIPLHAVAKYFSLPLAVIMSVLTKREREREDKSSLCLSSALKSQWNLKFIL